MPVINPTNPTLAAEQCAPAGAGSIGFVTQQTQGLTQNGCFLTTDDKTVNVQELPSLTRVQLPSGTNPTILQLGPQEYKVVLSLSGTSTVQLTPAYGNCLNVPTVPVSPAVAAFTYTTRQRLVATVSSSGLVTAVGRGETIILVSSVRGVNNSFPGATNPAGLTGCEIALELRVVVLA